MKRKIPIGIQDYRELRIDNYYTVDKTLMIADFLQRGSKVTLITRPRRFGKTLNMSMLAEFFDITKDSKSLFEGLAIMNTDYGKEINRHPVIFVSFKDCKGTYEDIAKYTKLSILTEFKRYKHVFKDMDEYDIPRYDKMIKCLLDDEKSEMRSINNALAFLANQLESYYNKKAMIFIDEYDTPFIEAHMQGCYEKLHNDLAALLRTALKGCDSVNMAMLTGIQRVAKENVFSDLNNLVVCTVKDNEYDSYFGFTKEETKKLLEEYDLSYSEEVKQMYDGYRIGEKEIYNPWSIINYASRKKLEPFWINTSSNSMIKSAMNKCDISFKNGFEELIKNDYLDTKILLETSFYEHSQTTSLWGLFVNAGYLTIEKVIRESRVRIRIPNNEVRREFISLTEYFLKISEGSLDDMFYSLIEKDMSMFFKEYQQIILTIPSYHDLKEENSFHMMMLGMSIYLKGDYEILSNRENGVGRADIILKKRKENFPNIVIEFKYTKKESTTDKDLENLAKVGLNQIKEKNYTVDLHGDTICIGLAHHGKQVYMEYEEMNVG